MAISTVPYVRHNESFTIPLTVSLTMPFTVSLAIALSVTLSIMSLPVPLVVSFLEEEEGVRACLRAGVWIRRNEYDHEEDEGEKKGERGQLHFEHEEDASTEGCWRCGGWKWSRPQ